MPGFSATTTCPRTGTTAGSGTSVRAPTPVQFTTTGAATEASDVTVPADTDPPSPSYRRSRYSRYTGMFTAGAVYCQPETNPVGQVAGAKDAHVWQQARPRRRLGELRADLAPRQLVHPGGGLAGQRGQHAEPGPRPRVAPFGGPQRTGPQIAPAAADVVAAGGAAVITRVASPASASETAVVSPITPAPTTTASTQSWHDATSRG